MKITITEKQSGKNILGILRGDLALSAGVVTALKKNPVGILLNGEHVTVRHFVKEGDMLSLDFFDNQESSENILPIDLPLTILYCDNDIMVVNKPPFMPTHPSHDHQKDTLANGVAFFCQKKGFPFVFRAINRLDADTSGVVLIALHKAAASRLGKQMKEGKIKKEYVAMLEGKLIPESGEIHSPLRRKEGSSMLREICETSDIGAIQAATAYKVLASNPMYSLVAAMPLTGRTHQLRVHFSSLGTPICGDTLYGFPSPYIQRQALHAYQLKFNHPMTGNPMNIVAPLPKDIKELYFKTFDTDILPF